MKFPFLPQTVCVLLHLDDAEEISDRIEQLTTDSEALPQLQLVSIVKPS